MDTLKLDDFTGYHFLSSVALSPDGRYAAYKVQKSNEEKKGYVGDLWIYDLQLKSPRRLTGHGDAGGFIWLDDETILFNANRERDTSKKTKQPQTIYYTINIHGGEAIKAFTVPYQVLNIDALGNGKYVLQVLDKIRDQAQEAHVQQGELAESDKENEDEDDYLIMEEIPFWGNGVGHTNKKRVSLFVFDSNKKAEEQFTAITAPHFSTDVFKINANKTKLVYAGSEFNCKLGLFSSISTYDIETQTTTEIVPEGKYQVGYVDYLQDEVIFVASEAKKFMINENVSFYKMNADGQVTCFLSPDLSLVNSVGSDCRLGGGRSHVVAGDTIYQIVTQRYYSRLAMVNVSGELSYHIEPKGSVDCFDLKQDKLVFIGLRDQGLQELYQYDLATGTETQLTHYNTEVLANKYVASPQSLTFINQDGIEIDGWVLLPKDYDASLKYPAILNIHGGPKTVYGTVFYHEMQVWANQGYFVFFANPRGGDGRGDDFADIRGQYGGIDYNDLMEFTDQVLDKYPAIDRKRVGVTGGSYGGFMTNWIIGHTDRFAAAISQRSISNWISMCTTTDIGYYFAVDQVGADPWKDAEKMWQQSPLKYADRCTTPTLFLHSDEDYRCWYVEAIQMFTALQMHGVTTKLCLFKGENHELSRSGKPNHRIRRLQEIDGWFKQYLGN